MHALISRTARILSPLALLSPAARAAPGQEPAWRIQGDQAHAHLGSSIATADVNGDGFGDLVVGAPEHDGARIDGGRVLVFHGSPGGLASTPDWERQGLQARARFGARVARAGDVNGDGFEDVLISAPDWDVLANPANPFHVGAPGQERYTTDEGRVFLFLGSPAGLEYSPRSAVAGIERREHFGSAVAGVGDVNGDGFGDVAIGATGKAGGMGGVFFFAGTPSGELGGPSWIEIRLRPFHDGAVGVRLDCDDDSGAPSRRALRRPRRRPLRGRDRRPWSKQPAAQRVPRFPDRPCPAADPATRPQGRGPLPGLVVDPGPRP